MASQNIAPRRLLDLSLEDKQRFVDSFDYVFTDCDGVVWDLFGAIPGVGPAISALKGSGKHVVYVSNNSVRTLENYRQQFRKLGQEDVDEHDIVYPAVSVVQYLKAIRFEGLIYAIAAEPFLNTLRQAGYEVISGPNEPQPESLSHIIPVIKDKKPVRAVIVDFDFNCNHVKLLRAELYLKSSPDVLFVAGAMDKVITITSEFQILGPGHYVEMLEKATDLEAHRLGKPGRQLAQQLKKRYDIEDTKRVLFVGDMVEQDVGFGLMAGFQTLLVLTGGATQKDVPKLGEGVCVPEYYTESFADLEQVVREVLDMKRSKSNL